MTDLRFDFELNDLVYSADVATVSGDEETLQRFRFRVSTGPLDFALQPEIGSMLPGKVMSPEQEHLRRALADAVQADAGVMDFEVVQESPLVVRIYLSTGGIVYARL